MSHQTAFIITSVTTDFPNETPTTDQLRHAAREAGRIAVTAASQMDQQSGEDPAPESLAVGSRQHQFIQGNRKTNRETFGNIPTSWWPELTFEIWGENNGQKADAADAPEDVISNAWNHADALIALALKSKWAQNPTYPEILITPDATVSHQLKYHDEDVFHDPSPGGTVALFLPDQDPALSWHMAKRPLAELEQANFRINYLRTLAAYPGHIVVEFDWNL